MQNVFDKSRQPRFSTLRPLGNFTGQTPDPTILYEELWKHDEYIHNIPERVDLDSIPCPSPPKKSFFETQLSFNNRLKAYEEEKGAYDAAIDRAKAINQAHDNFNNVKKGADYTCYFCTFRDDRYSEIHHLDGNHFNNDMQNLVCACTLCHRQHHLLWVAMRDDAQLAAANIDHLTQTELNHIQRIAIVMKDDPRYADVLGMDGKLGSVLNLITASFARPLHPFLVPESERNDSWLRYCNENKVNNIINGNTAYYRHLDVALKNLDNLKPSKTEKEALDQYEVFIGAADLMKTDPNATADDVRYRCVNDVQNSIAQFKKSYEIEFEEKFESNTNNFTVFELAVALKNISYSDFKEFNPRYMYLVYRDTVFSEEQLAYYKTLDYFNVDNWGFGSN